MNKQFNTEKQGLSFSKAYESLNWEDRRQIKKEITEYTEWSRNTFYNKKRRIYPLTKLEIAVIEMVFLDYGICAWTGEETSVVQP